MEKYRRKTDAAGAAAPPPVVDTGGSAEELEGQDDGAAAPPAIRQPAPDAKAKQEIDEIRKLLREEYPKTDLRGPRERIDHYRFDISNKHLGLQNIDEARAGYLRHIKGQSDCEIYHMKLRDRLVARKDAGGQPYKHYVAAQEEIVEI